MCISGADPGSYERGAWTRHGKRRWSVLVQAAHCTKKRAARKGVGGRRAGRAGRWVRACISYSFSGSETVPWNSPWHDEGLPACPNAQLSELFICYQLLNCWKSN